MNTTRSVLFALLSLGFLAVSANAQNAEDIDRLAQEAADFYVKGKYREARASMTRAYAAFERLEVKDKTKRVEYLRVLANISNALQENDKTIEYATEVAIHALTDNDRGFAYNTLGLAYGNKGEYDKAIGYYEKDLAIQLKKLGVEHPRVGTSYNNIGLAYRSKGEYDKALKYYEKALAIRLKKLGAEHPAVAQTDPRTTGQDAIVYQGTKRRLSIGTQQG